MMKTFLGEVAQTLYERYGDQISSCEILFPSRRARLFFTEALGRLIKTPLWQPQWRSMDELMEQVSGLRRGDRLRLLTELYKLYSTFHDEPFDRFYFWGEMLLSDFDTIDKYNIPADQLFRNIEDIKEIEADISYLTPRQLQILKFWSSLGADADLSVEKQRFLAIWRTLLPLYEQFRERLQSLGFAYGGMIQREAARRIRSGEFAFEADRHFVVAGFNALSACEKELFRCMQTTAKTDFFWDFDTYYTAREEQEAGMFVRKNQQLFPAAAPISHEGMSRPKQMAAVAAASNAVQCKYVTEILRRWAAEGPLDKETAIVLTDEELLMPLLYSLPPELGKVNVTMGYPLQQTPAYTLVERLIALQARGRRQGAGWAFYHADVMGLLMHPCLQGCCSEERKQLCWEIVQERRITLDTERLSVAEPLGQIFRPVGSWQELSDWLQQCLMLAATQPIAEQEQARMREYLAVTSEAVTKLHNSLDACDIELTVEIYTSLLRRHLQTVRIPFEGEPLEGIQVMGILETRNLDFKRVIILSMTDDNFPGNLMGQSSFIPYTLRAAYDLPTPEHHEGVYAYYFYRLIQRAEEVQMLYCSHADDRSTGELSRYIRQLDYESGFTVQQIDVGVDVNLTDVEPIEVVKDAAIMRRLERYLDPESPAALSPSSFGRYVSCPLRFYFHSVARLKSEEEVNEELDAPMFGTILHAAAQELYEQVLHAARPGELLQAMARSGAIAKAVERAIATYFLRKEQAEVSDYTGNLLLVRDVVIRYLKELLRFDAEHDDFTVEGCECEVDYGFPLLLGDRQAVVKFAGKVDRLDRMEDGSLRVVDFKTGKPHLAFAGIKLLFEGKEEQRVAYVLQTLLYSMMLHHRRGCEVVPSLYYVRSLTKPDYSPYFTDRERKEQGVPYTEYAAEFEQMLARKLTELFDPETPFRQCEDVNACEYCDFRVICRR